MSNFDLDGDALSALNKNKNSTSNIVFGGDAIDWSANSRAPSGPAPEPNVPSYEENRKKNMAGSSFSFGDDPADTPQKKRIVVGTTRAEAEKFGEQLESNTARDNTTRMYQTNTLQGGCAQSMRIVRFSVHHSATSALRLDGQQMPQTHKQFAPVLHDNICLGVSGAPPAANTATASIPF